MWLRGIPALLLAIVLDVIRMVVVGSKRGAHGRRLLAIIPLVDRRIASRVWVHIANTRDVRTLTVAIFAWAELSNGVVGRVALVAVCMILAGVVLIPVRMRMNSSVVVLRRVGMRWSNETRRGLGCDNLRCGRSHIARYGRRGAIVKSH